MAKSKAAEGDGDDTERKGSNVASAILLWVQCHRRFNLSARMTVLLHIRGARPHVDVAQCADGMFVIMCEPATSERNRRRVVTEKFAPKESYELISGAVIDMLAILSLVSALVLPSRMGVPRMALVDDFSISKDIKTVQVCHLPDPHPLMHPHNL